jgi:uncharacterized membrane protein YeaQ/YmgE (transglycosylase-associated protein family)
MAAERKDRSCAHRRQGRQVTSVVAILASLCASPRAGGKPAREYAMILMAAGIPSYNFPIPKGSFFDLVFHQTNFSLQILGLLNPPLSLNLIGLIIIVLIAFAANAVTERLTSSKAGGLFTAVLITLIGSYLFAAFVRFPFDFQLEGVRIIAALLGAIIIAVFYTLIRKQGSSKKS